MCESVTNIHVHVCTHSLTRSHMNWIITVLFWGYKELQMKHLFATLSFRIIWHASYLCGLHLASVCPIFTLFSELGQKCPSPSNRHLHHCQRQILTLAITFISEEMALILKMCIPCDNTFHMVPFFFYLLEPWPWSLTYFWKTLTLAAI